MIAISRPVTGPEEILAMQKIFESGWLGLGSTVYEFEEELKKYLGVGNAIAVNTGTSALHIALAGFGVGPGDEVILPSITFAACVQAVISLGARPVFAESHEESLLIDIDDVEKKLTSKTKVVMPVHFAGASCDMLRLMALAEQRGFKVIEDAAHAFGSDYKGRKVGTMGHAACFSFDPIKNITTGEGGAVVLSDDGVAEDIRRMRILGIDKDTWNRYKNTRAYLYEVVSPGYRYHMPNFCAAVGLEQLKKLPGFIARRREIGLRYQKAFTGVPGLTPIALDLNEVVPHIYIVRVAAERRDAFMEALKGRGVGTGVHYIANHSQPFFSQYAKEPLPRADILWREIVTLPMHCALTDAEVDTVIEAVLAFFASPVASAA
ncbi:MAG: aminotransferase [Elusimicrobia bacterium CG_4_9_14_3_um_filter_62_55]|nr:MAG: aminotransferase [Elusimicrobia bacterium CG22_combo_CG10-13_8_21_14_all_63_91]PJB24397.1 MAG: aminotransferase [Elusimicrobia bacterium CG_4_9_14_3_um_filter_62_55]